MTEPIETGCPEDMTPEVPPGTTPVEGIPPDTYVQNNVFDGPQFVEEVPSDDIIGAPDEVYTSVKPSTNVSLNLDINWTCLCCSFRENKYEHVCFKVHSICFESLAVSAYLLSVHSHLFLFLSPLPPPIPLPLSVSLSKFARTIPPELLNHF